MIEMTVDQVRGNIPGNQRVVVLKGKEIDRYLPIWVGQSEGDAIALTLRDQNPARPMTHDLMDSMIRGLGATVARVEVSAMSDDTFIANVALRDQRRHLRRRTPGRVTPSHWRCAAVRPSLRQPEVLDKFGDRLRSGDFASRPRQVRYGWSSQSWRAEGAARHNPPHTDKIALIQSIDRTPDRRPQTDASLV